MDKIWKLTESKSDKVILIHEKSIYKGNPSKDDINRLNTENPDIPIIKSLFAVPYSYIKKIINQEGKNHIKIYFGKDSEEELNVSNEILKNEIFDYLKKDISDLKYKSETPNVIK
jgi:hypothetical protein